MERPLEKPDTSTSYLEFFGLTQPPFAKLSQPSQIYHTDQNALLMAHLANATDQPDCLVVICGAEGSGKTALLNSYIAGLGNQVSFAIIDETCAGEAEFYGAFLKQIGFSDITGTPNELRHITDQFLVNRGKAGDPVLIVIDNAERIGPTVFEQLRRISAITVEDRRVLSVVLAGNSQLVHVMSSPAMTQIKFNNQVHFNVRRYTEDETAKYVWQRLWWAGGIESVKISDDAYPLIFRYTGGVARQINMLCNDVLREARALESRVITASLVRSVANRRQLIPHVVPLHGMGRRKTDPDYMLAQPELQAEEIKTALDTATIDKVEETVPESYTSAVGGQDLREQLSDLREQISDLTADKLRALQDISMRNEDITELRNRLHAQTAETKKLASALESNADEIRRQSYALADSTKALQESEEATKKLAADLEKERVAAKTAQADIAKAEARADELGQLRNKLDAQTAKTEKLAKALESNADEIGRQNQALDDSTKALQASEKAAEKFAADLEKERIATQTAQAEIEKARARTEELGQLRDKLDTQTAKTEKLAKALESNAGEIGRQNQALDDSTKALQASEKAAEKLAADLEKERVAAKTAQADIAKAETRADELGQLRDKLDTQTAKTEKLAKALESNADEIGRQNQALDDSTKALQASEKAAEKLAADLEKERVAAQTAQAEIEKARARTEELGQLRDKLDAQTAEIEKLTNALESNAGEIRRQNHALADSTEALQESEEAAKKLAANLENERVAAKTAQADIAKAEARADELGQLRDKLDAQTAKTEELSKALENNADEIGRQNQALDDSTKALHESEEAAKKLAANLENERVAAKTAQTDIARAKEKAEELSHLKIELQAAISNLTADLEQAEDRVVGVDALEKKLIESVPACQTLKEYDQATYNCLITTCEHMFRQSYSEQQIEDALRVLQAELIERRVHKASDKAVINYAQLIVDQLREYQIHGAALCFGTRVPQTGGGHDGSPAISKRTREREYALLELTLRTYNANMGIPTDEDVWPDLEPIFLELLEAYGDANVSAHFDPNAPNADKEMTSSISMSLYREILKLRKMNAATALRWILSP